MARAGAVLLALALIPLAIFVKIRLSLETGEVYAAVSNHDVTLWPDASLSRFRFHDYKLKEHDDFFQWWNYLVFDAETRRHWTIAYGTTYNRQDGLVGSCTVIERHDAKDVASGSMVTRFGERFAINNHYDVVQKDEQGNVVFRHTVLDSDTYRIEGKTADVQFDLTVKRINGNFVGKDMVEAQQTDCAVMSTYYGYHSMVEGSIRSRASPSISDAAAAATTTTATGATKAQWHTYSVDHSKRFRAYAAGSFGCHLPTGVPPIEYPWYWFWLIIPNDDINKDIGMAMGAGRMQDKLGGLDLEAGLSMIDSKAHDLHHSTRFARVLYDTPAMTHLMASTSDGFVSNISIAVSDWKEVEDAMGKASVPHRQIYHITTKALTMTVDFRVEYGQYFRIPFKHYDWIYSDFRAVGVRAHVFIKRTDTGVEVFNDWVSGMNALEYAYVTPYPSPPELLAKFRPVVSK